MNRDDLIRRALRTSAFFNLGGAAAFAFPGSLLGGLVGLPSTVPPMYCALVTWFVVLFGGTYAWLARQPTIHRPIVAFAAIGKGGAFAMVLLLWWFDAASLLSAVAMSADLVFAAIFAWWWLGSRPEAAS